MADDTVGTDVGEADVDGTPAEATAGIPATFRGEPESSNSLRTFGAVVQALREHAGMSRQGFAEQVRFSKHTVASVELGLGLGRRMPDPTFVERAEDALGNTGRYGRWYGIWRGSRGWRPDSGSGLDWRRWRSACTRTSAAWFLACCRPRRTRGPCR